MSRLSQKSLLVLCALAAVYLSPSVCGADPSYDPTLVRSLRDVYPKVTLLEPHFCTNALIRYRRIVPFTNVVTEVTAFLLDGNVRLVSKVLINNTGFSSLDDFAPEAWETAPVIREVVRNDAGVFLRHPEQVFQTVPTNSLPDPHLWRRHYGIDGSTLNPKLFQIRGLGFNGLPAFPAQSQEQGLLQMDCSTLYRIPCVSEVRFDPATGLILSHADRSAEGLQYEWTLTLDALDPADADDLFSIDSAQLYEPETEYQTTSGVGLVVDLERSSHGPFLVRRTVPNSPAEQAGILRGDVLLGVDGASTHGLRWKEVSDLIQGEHGTPVSLLIRRDNTETNIPLMRGLKFLIIP